MTERSSPRSNLPPFDAADLTRATRDALDVRRVFGDAYERGATWVIPVAKVMGGTGAGVAGGAMGGEGPRTGAGDDRAGRTGARTGPQGQGEGTGGGGGFGVRVKPLGVYVVDDAGVHWRPALDLNRVILGGQAVGAVLAVCLAWALRRRRR
ncbi:spore germination protein GerW family protein [Cellulomonas fimi]|uniref:Sporulation protein YtfJ n=1 Tax=Cellulomonas fimi TaxID=1708 RepID=A0A7Y0LZ69_CELFI|nr:spore germination protein GerW family protein [Cellulomonas fimi]NMR20584.1 hypothetical protein [Cellulomonas fimi]